MIEDVRRVVTAQQSGIGVVSADGRVPNVFEVGSGITVIDVWKTLQTPASLLPDAVLPADDALALAPPAGGTVFRLTEFLPEPEGGVDAAVAAGVFAALQAGEAVSGAAQSSNALMHRTRTVDYCIVLQGEITLVLDREEVVLRAGDVVVQRGASHSWANRSGAPCRMAFVMIDAAADSDGGNRA
jgi:quercetin dioxygenase-like cupin family protein